MICYKCTVEVPPLVVVAGVPPGFVGV